MPKLLLKDLDPRVQKQVAAAEQSLRTNPQYAAEIAQGVLSRHPECVELRRLLRKGQKLALGASAAKGFGKLLGSVTSFAGLMGTSKLVESDPMKAIEAAEKTLAKKPTDIGANKMLAAAAEKLGWYDTAAFAWEEITHSDPKNLSNYLSVGTTYMKDHDYDSALRIMDNALKLFPGNGDLQEMARRASVAKTMNQGKWDEDGDYKNKLRSQEDAIKLQKSDRVVQDADEAAAAAAALETRIAADPENVDLYREAVKNYQAMGDLDKAIDTLKRARQTNIGRADAALEKQENDLSLANMAKKLKEIEDQLAQDPDNAELRTRYETAKEEERVFRLQVFQTLVEKYPNDYGYRYELGVMLLEAGRNDDAIHQLQVAQRNPKNRHAAMLNLARAFINGNKYDMAAEQLQTAKGEIQVMSDVKKEIMYELGIALEKLGREKEAIDEYKVIYMSDSGYKDVSQKINEFYEKKR
ncbi:MAG: tetratricopeptide repeat protein [Puniceicoccales bacterium]|jgi:tetratricopeptide (TPR) repeat protein|nr:tetratricopeptide repeat protein [Puniceicoccales bacterium]